jgi:hypothetical protein
MASLAGALALNSLRGGATARIVDSTVEAHTVGVMASTHDAVIDATTAFGPALRNTPSTDLVMGAVIALNVVGQDISTDALIALNLVEAVLGSTFDGATPSRSSSSPRSATPRSAPMAISTSPRSPTRSSMRR